MPVIVEVLLREACLVECAAATLARAAVQLLRVGEQVEKVREGLACRFEPRVFVVIDLAGEPVPFVPDGPQPGGDLVLRPVRVTDQVEEAIFLLAQVLQPFRYASPDFRLGVGRLDQCLLDQRGDPLAQLGGQRDRRVVVEHCRFRLGDGQVGEVAGVELPAPAEVVEMKVAGLALASHDHESALASGAPDRALEVVVVRALADSARASRLQHLLDAVEDLCRDQRLVPALVFVAAILDAAEVVAIAEKVA
nr:hypothetical protein [Actinoplanes sp. TBRC 11911]